MEIARIGVVGFGQMGGGIAHSCALAGYHTIVREADQAPLDRGQERLEKQLARDVSKNKLSVADRDALLGRLTRTTELDALADCDLVIEAIIEDPAAKKDLFAALDRVCKPATILASNTSSIPIITIASPTKRPDQVVGMHFFNPVPVMALIELVRSIATSDQTVAAITGVGARMGKQVITAPDAGGFIVNRLLMPYLFDAIRMFEAGVATREDLDAGMRIGCAHPMGPLTLLDFIGLDTAHNIGLVLYEEFGEARYAPPPLLRRMVAAGYVGRKSGRGFYEY